MRRCLSASRLVTLTGIGGVGKTRLAMEIAADSRRAFADRVWFVDLAPITDGELVAQAVAAELGIREHSTRPVLDQITEHVAEQRLLIVLDNCEHLLDACSVVVDRMLRRCSMLRVLATSRRTLGIAGEYVFPVPSLTVPDPDRPVSVEALGQYEAVSLLVERASAVQPGFTVTEANYGAVVQLCADLDGVPLSIELAATRLRSLSVEQVVDRLADRFALLTGGSRAALPRQRTLRALTNWSYDLCSLDEKRLWARLSVFSGGFDLEAAEEVCAGDGLRRQDILGLTDSLVSQSIVVRADADRKPRFRMLETIRRYGLDRLGESGEREALRRKHRDFYAALAQRAYDHWCGPGQENSLARLRDEHGNLRAALDWSLTEDGEVQSALALSGALCWHWCADGFLSEGRLWLDQALALPADPTPVRARALWVAGWVALLQGDFAAVVRRLGQCQRLAEQVADPALMAHAASLAGSAAAFQGEAAEAIGWFEEAISGLTAAGDNGGALLAMFQLAGDLLVAGEPERSAAIAQQAIGISEERGEHWARSYALWTLARCAWLADELDEARRLAEAAMELQRGFRDSVGVALMIDTMAWIAASKAEFTWAAGLLGAADSVWRSIGASISAFGPMISQHHDECERQTKRALREHAYRVAFEQGVQSSVPAAVDYALHRPAKAPGVTPVPVLTRRERDVAVLIGQGLSNRQIAERLVVSPRTINGHVDHILAKLDFTSRARVAAWVVAGHVGGAGTSAQAPPTRSDP